MLRSIPFLLLFHIIEEVLTIPQWIERHQPMLREKVLFFILLEFSPVQLYISLALVTVAPAIIARSCLKRDATPQAQR